MIVLLDTSTPVCKLSFVDGGEKTDVEWRADRTLAKGLLGYLNDQLEQRGQTWSDIAGIGVFAGPGSFTGLRIGLTVMNTIADAEGVPIVGAQGEDWQDNALMRLNDGQDEHIVMPFYGGDAHITTPRK